MTNHRSRARRNLSLALLVCGSALLFVSLLVWRWEILLVAVPALAASQYLTTMGYRQYLRDRVK